jgi:hypothetical protein
MAAHGFPILDQRGDGLAKGPACATAGHGLAIVDLDALALKGRHHGALRQIERLRGRRRGLKRGRLRRQQSRQGPKTGMGFLQAIVIDRQPA